jgi:glycerol uptake facilitator-like aquaporin
LTKTIGTSKLGLVGIRSVVSRNGENNSTRFGIFILAPIMGGIRATLVAKLLDIEA